MNKVNQKNQLSKDTVLLHGQSYIAKNQSIFVTELIKILTAAAMILPGLIQPLAHAAEEDSVDFQYSHYQEGKREGAVTNAPCKVAVC